MRLEKDNLPEPWGFKRICHTCGKSFYPAPYHQFKVGYRIYFCSWSCYNHRDKRLKYKDTTPLKHVLMFTSNGDFIAEFYCANDVCDYLADKGILVNIKIVREVCQGKRKSHHGYIFKYK